MSRHDEFDLMLGADSAKYIEVKHQGNSYCIACQRRPVKYMVTSIFKGDGEHESFICEPCLDKLISGRIRKTFKESLDGYINQNYDTFIKELEKLL